MGESLDTVKYFYRINETDKTIVNRIKDKLNINDISPLDAVFIYER